MRLKISLRLVAKTMQVPYLEKCMSPSKARYAKALEDVRAPLERRLHISCRVVDSAVVREGSMTV